MIISYMTREGWRTVAIPEQIMKEVDKEVNRKGSLYNTISGFVVDSVRLNLTGGMKCKH